MVEVSIHRARLNAFHEVVAAAHALLDELGRPRGVSVATRNNLILALGTIAETPDDGWEPWDIDRMVEAVEEADNELDRRKQQVIEMAQKLTALAESWESKDL